MSAAVCNNCGCPSIEVVQIPGSAGAAGANGTTPNPLTAGTFTLNGATQVTVSNAAVTTASVIVMTLKTGVGTVGAAPTVKTITPGVGFNVAGTAADLSIFNYVIIG